MTDPTQDIWHLLKTYCQSRCNLEFDLEQFVKHAEPIYEERRPEEQFHTSKVRQSIEELYRQDELEYLGSGRYRLSGLEIESDDSATGAADKKETKTDQQNRDSKTSNQLLEVDVCDPDGNPIPEAVVEVSDGDLEVTGTTDTAGRYIFSLGWVADVVSVEISKPGYETDESQLEFRGSKKTLFTKLTPESGPKEPSKRSGSAPAGEYDRSSGREGVPNLRVQLIDTKANPIKDVEVSIVGEQQAATTSENGMCDLSAPVTNGEVTLAIRPTRDTEITTTIDCSSQADTRTVMIPRISNGSTERDTSRSGNDADPDSIGPNDTTSPDTTDGTDPEDIVEKIVRDFDDEFSG